MITVTKTFFPPFEDYQAKLRQIWESGWLTDCGMLEKELTLKAGQYLTGINPLFYYLKYGRQDG